MDRIIYYVKKGYLIEFQPGYSAGEIRIVMSKDDYRISYLFSDEMLKDVDSALKHVLEGMRIRLDHTGLL